MLEQFFTLSPEHLSSRFAVSFRRINRWGSAFMFLRRFKLAHICIH